jgi:hypothetical protein
MDDEVSLWNWQKGIYKGYISQVVTWSHISSQ